MKINRNCECTAEDMTGWVGIKCCNLCGLPVRGESLAFDSPWLDANLVKPEKSCLAFYRNRLGKRRLVKAFYAKKFEMEADIYWDDGYEGCDYDEESDTYYVAEGWYEEIDNWDDLSFISITEGTVTHWMPLPVMPEAE